MTRESNGVSDADTRKSVMMEWDKDKIFHFECQSKWLGSWMERSSTTAVWRNIEPRETILDWSQL